MNCSVERPSDDTKAGGEKQGSFMPKFHRSSVPICWIPQGFTVDHQE